MFHMVHMKEADVTLQWANVVTMRVSNEMKIKNPSLLLFNFRGMEYRIKLEREESDLQVTTMPVLRLSNEAIHAIQIHLSFDSLLLTCSAIPAQQCRAIPV